MRKSKTIFVRTLLLTELIQVDIRNNNFVNIHSSHIFCKITIEKKLFTYIKTTYIRDHI